jgi:hypothetical protein
LANEFCRSFSTAFTAAKAAISNEVYQYNCKDYAGHGQYDTSEYSGLLNLAYLVFGDLHVGVDARCEVNPATNCAKFHSKLFKVDQ